MARRGGLRISASPTGPDFDRMSNGVSGPRRQGQRRRHHRWNGPDHFPNDGRAPFFHHYDSLKSSRMSLPAVPSEARRQGRAPAPVPDELSLEHMSQDCTLVKNQLLRLKNLLQLEDPDSPADVAGEIAGNTNTVSQFEELLKEVHMLREELRSRDKTIVQLTLQCQQLQQHQHQREQVLARERQVRCRCQQQRAPSLLRQPADKLPQRPCDKATQTHWRPPSHVGVLPTPSSPPWQAPPQALTCAGMPQRRPTSNTFQPQRAFPPGKTGKNSPHRGPQ